MNFHDFHAGLHTTCPPVSNDITLDSYKTGARFETSNGFESSAIRSAFAYVATDTRDVWTCKMSNAQTEFDRKTIDGDARFLGVRLGSYNVWQRRAFQQLHTRFAGTTVARCTWRRGDRRARVPNKANTNWSHRFVFVARVERISSHAIGDAETTSQKRNERNQKTHDTVLRPLWLSRRWVPPYLLLN